MAPRGHPRSHDPSDQRMGRGRGQPEILANQIPGDRTQEGTEYKSKSNLRIAGHQGGRNNSRADKTGLRVPTTKELQS